MNEPTTPRVADAAGRARFTTAEFVRMGAAGAFDDMKIELVAGELERMNPPMSAHGFRQSEVGYQLRGACEGSRLAVAGEIGIELASDTVRACDAAIVTEMPIENRLLRPDEILLVVEIAETTLARDLGSKRIDYATAGIANYWVVDGQRSVTHVYTHPVSGDYADVRTIAFGSPIDVPGTDRTITLA